MQSSEIRQRFTDFFVARGHRPWPSSPLIPADPSLLLTVAGMVQFKPFFLGERTPEVPRATSVQKCARTLDIENVGHTTRHLTFFEMLGNFSFGDYFKDDAIAWALELVTQGYGFDRDRLWATIYDDDDEAYAIWRKVGLPDERIQRRGMEDNYWSTGAAGPCGPCSEIYYDRGPAHGRDGGPVADEERYLEVWNLVFMQYLRDEDFNILGELPRKNIDTGMGLERMAILLQGVDNVFETDVLAPILREVQELTARGYGEQEHADVSLRVVAEHARSASFLIADGVLPSNEGRGYILRRLLRRGVRHLRLLGLDEPGLARVTDRVVATLGGAWPELAANQPKIAQVAANEEEAFGRTLRRGSVLLDSAIAGARERGEASVSGDTAFNLYATHGFPFELTLEAAEEAGLGVDRDRFVQLMDQHAKVSSDLKSLEGADRELAAERGIVARHGPTDFTGYDRTTDSGRVLALLDRGEELPAAGEGDEVLLVLDRTPFYAEGGGQVGDAGTVTSASGALLEVTDTRQDVDGLWVHRARVRRGELRPGDEVEAAVDAPRRAAVARSHSATHVLHWALRDRLGQHANQHGSLVDAGRLRFDFSHFSALDPEQLAEVEATVNAHLLDDPEVRSWYASLEEARRSGAVALFGEKYGEVVRIVDIGDFSRELCGGTHVGHGSQVGPVRILGESSIGANLRRIEALTGADALRWYDRERRLLGEVAALLRTRPEDAPERLRRTLAMLKEADAELARLREARLERRAEELAAGASAADGAWLVLGRLDDVTVEDLRRVALGVRARRAGAPGVVVLGAETAGKASLVAVVTTDLVDRGIAARDVLLAAAKEVGGGAGGKGDLATAGGRDPARLAEALEVARAEAVRRLGGS
ncbi:MAG TPA: alanine--tRNA ligase [Actinomycetes bacterium]|nr:alanine--tRNA ligase [Actinomycetes bacterium]